MMIASKLIDGCGRRIDHLRLSVTDQCDLRCTYCRPTGTDTEADSGQPLTNIQRAVLVRFMRENYGLSRVRITGGEPLTYPHVVDLVRRIRESVPDIEIAMTTNGRLLHRLAVGLRSAGLDRLNMSLDSVDASTYRTITGGNVADALRGLESAERAGFPPPKVNTVVLRGVNDHEVSDLAQFAMDRGCEARFLEAMPIGPAADANRKAFVPSAEVLDRLASRFELRALPRSAGETATRYVITDGERSGVVGTISPITAPFCGDCRRIRISADGRLFPCLLDHASVSLRDGFDEQNLLAESFDGIVRAAVRSKQPAGRAQRTPMIVLGG